MISYELIEGEMGHFSRVPAEPDHLRGQQKGSHLINTAIGETDSAGQTQSQMHS